MKNVISCNICGALSIESVIKKQVGLLCVSGKSYYSFPPFQSFMQYQFPYFVLLALFTDVIVG